MPFSLKKKREQGPQTREEYKAYYRDQFTREVLATNYYSATAECRNCGFRVGMFIELASSLSDAQCHRCHVKAVVRTDPKGREKLGWMLPDFPEDVTQAIEKRIEELLGPAMKPTEKAERVLGKLGKQKKQNWLV